MGEYEPNDSRKVTLEEGNVPGEPPRTGPREDEARRKAKQDEDGKAMPQPQQRAAQSQQQSGQSQSQSQSGATRPVQEQPEAGLWGEDAPRMARSFTPGEPGNPDTQDMQSEPGGPLAGNQKQAIDNPAGSATPEDDQYEVNQPQNMHQQDADHERRVREQASSQEADRGFGYGVDGDAEMQDAPDASEHETREAHEGTEAREAEERGYGGGSEAKEAYDAR